MQLARSPNLTGLSVDGDWRHPVPVPVHRRNYVFPRQCAVKPGLDVLAVLLIVLTPGDVIGQNGYVLRAK